MAHNDHQQPLPPNSDSDYSVIVREEHVLFLKKIVDHYKNKDEENYLLLVEKLLYLVLEYLSNNPTKKLPFDPVVETNSYLEQMNRKSVEAFNTGQTNQAAKHITRVVDLLNQKNIMKIYSSQLKLFESKILTYNNLSCLYRKLGKLSLSHKVISFALDLEEKLAAEGYGSSNISIISTYLNKSSILSQMGKHDQALEAVKKAFEKMDNAEVKQNLDENEKTHLQSLRMSAFYNMAMECEHLDRVEKASANYEKAKEYAKKLGKQTVVTKIDKALMNLKRSK